MTWLRCKCSIRLLLALVGVIFLCGAPVLADDPDDVYWSPLGLGMNNRVYALTVYDNKLIAGGSFTMAGGVVASRIAAWNGSFWSPLGSGMDGDVVALTVYDNKLIAAGFFTTAGGVAANYIAAWDGSSWSPLRSGMSRNVNALTVYNNKLIAGGDFSTAGGVAANLIASWDGSSWSPLGSGMYGSSNPWVEALTVYDNKLIVGGNFSTAGGVAANYVAAWNGSSWSPLGSGMDYWVYSFTVHDNKLIAGGVFTTAGGVAAGRIAAWNGSFWSPFGSGMNDGVLALTVHDNQLIAGGWFDIAEGTEVGYITAWNGSSWTTLGSGVDISVHALTVYHSKLIVGGYFTSAGGKQCNRISQWNRCLDADGDGICDEDDNCPTIANPGQEDADGDRFGDVCDNCPYKYNPAQEDFDGDGIGNVCDSGKIAVTMTVDALEPAAGVAVDIYDAADALVAEIVTGTDGATETEKLVAGEYEIVVVTPLGFAPDAPFKTAIVQEGTVQVIFDLTPADIAAQPRSRAYWAQQLCQALKGRPKDYTRAQFSRFGSLIEQHFNDNRINPVENYVVPQPATQKDSLAVLDKLLSFGYFAPGEPFLRRIARGELIALMLNVVAGKISQIEPITQDGMTVSQAITYCDMLVNDLDCPIGDIPDWFLPNYEHRGEIARYIKASFIAGLINVGVTLHAGAIPSDVMNIAYKYVAEHPPVPTAFKLSQNYPNPFNPTTEIQFSLLEDASVKLDVYDILGRKVTTLIDEISEAGDHVVQWDGRDTRGREVASGIYFCRISGNHWAETKKMVLLR